MTSFSAPPDHSPVEPSSARHEPPRRTLAAGRFIVALALLTVMLGLIVRYTLPGPLARYSPDLALILNKHHASALVAKAEQLREKLQEALLQKRDELAAGSDGIAPARPPQREATTADTRMRRPRIDRTSPDAGTGRFAMPASNAGQAADSDVAALRAEIAALAARAIDAAPMNARAVRLMAETVDDRDQVRRLMTRAVKLSTRETLALAWLHADAVERGDFDILIDTADKIMRTRPDIIAAITLNSVSALQTEQSRKKLVMRMAEDPPWRSAFLRAVGEQVERPADLLALLTALTATDTPPTVEEVKTFLAQMLEREETTLAYTGWRLLVPRADTSAKGALHNSSFDREFTGYAFDWVALNGQGSDITQIDLDFGRKAMRVAFDGSRVKGFSVRQIVLLGAGSYRVSGRFRGWLAANRGLRWQLRCLYGTKEVLGQSDLLAKSDGTWESFDFAANVVDVDVCTAQMLILIHDARSASEEVVSGDIQFDDFAVTAEETAPPKAVSQDGPRREAAPKTGSGTSVPKQP